MAKIVFSLGVACSLALTGFAYANVRTKTFSGDIDGRNSSHPCPTLNVRFGEVLIPKPVHNCPCPEQANATIPKIAVHPPKALVAAAGPGDRVRLSWREYAPIFGGDVRTATSWELVRYTTEKETYAVTPERSICGSIIVTSIIPLFVGTILAGIVGLFFQNKTTAEA